MAQRRRTAPKRPTRKAPAKPRGSGSKVSATVSPSFTLFGGNFLSFSFGGGGGRRGRGKGGLLKRLSGFVLKGYREMTHPTSGKITPAEKGRSFDEFKDERPDLFEGQLGGDDVQDDGEDLDDGPDRSGHQDDGWQAGCPTCGHAPGGHYPGCGYGWHA